MDNAPTAEKLEFDEETEATAVEGNIMEVITRKITQLVDEIEDEFILNALSTMTLICMIEDFPNYAEHLPLEMIEWLIKLKAETEDFLEENFDKWAFLDMETEDK